MDYRTIEDKNEIADAVIFQKLTEAATWQVAHTVDRDAKQFCADVRAYAGMDPDDNLTDDIAMHGEQIDVNKATVEKLAPKITTQPVDVDRVVRIRMREQRSALERDHLTRVTLIDAMAGIDDTLVEQATREMIGFEGALHAVNAALDALGPDPEPDPGPSPEAEPVVDTAE